MHVDRDLYKGKKGIGAVEDNKGAGKRTTVSMAKGFCLLC